MVLDEYNISVICSQSAWTIGISIYWSAPYMDASGMSEALHIHLVAGALCANFTRFSSTQGANRSEACGRV